MKWPNSIKNNEFLTIINDSLRSSRYKYLYSDKKIIKKRFKENLGRTLDLNSPTYFNDKLQWLKLYWYDPLASKCADKYEVRSFIEEKIGDKYLNDLLGVYDSVEDIDLDKLPKSFVLKGTHGSGYNIICKDKSEMDWKKEFKKMRRWLRNNYYWHTREWVYKSIKPRIICEKYMEEKNTGDLKDYKIFCFNGEPKVIQVDSSRFNNHQKNIYDVDWNLLDVEINEVPKIKQEIKKPYSFNEMMKLSRILSEPFPHVRVDFYNLDGEIIFGELTFFHGNGMFTFNPPEFELEMGNWLELPKNNN